MPNAGSGYFPLFTAILLALTANFILPVHAEPVHITTTRVHLNAEKPTQNILDGLRYLGGIAISSDDNRLGGLSGLTIGPEGKRLTAISDQGDWLQGTLQYDHSVDGAGRLSGLTDVEMGRLLGVKGNALKAKRKSDSESLTRVDGGYVVSFERRHRLLRYHNLKAVPEALPTPPGLREAPNNGGIEALTALPGGHLLAITEDLRDAQGDRRGWLYANDAWRGLTFGATGDFKPTDLATLPGGDVLVLERSYSLSAGPAARISRIAGREIRPGNRLVGLEIARLGRPLTVDNMEGLDVIETDTGTRLYLISDDNFNPLQKTLILLFELLER